MIVYGRCTIIVVIDAVIHEEFVFTYNPHMIVRGLNVDICAPYPYKVKLRSRSEYSSIDLMKLNVSELKLL